MPEMRLCVDVSPELLRRFTEEATRQHDTIEHLLEHTVQVLLHDMEEDEEMPPDTDLVMP